MTSNCRWGTDGRFSCVAPSYDVSVVVMDAASSQVLMQRQARGIRPSSTGSQVVVLSASGMEAGGAGQGTAGRGNRRAIVAITDLSDYSDNSKQPLKLLAEYEKNAAPTPVHFSRSVQLGNYWNRTATLTLDNYRGITLYLAPC